MTKYLVVNSDDLGMCHSVNIGILRGFTEGVLTQASIMAPCPWFEEAAALAVSHNLPVGVHLTATCDWDHYRWRPLTPARSWAEKDGTFPSQMDAVRERADRGELEAEFAAQIEAVLARGITPTHLDSHMGLVDADVLARLCQRYGLRTPFGDAGDPARLGPDAIFNFASPPRGFTADDDPARKKADFLRWLETLGDGWHYGAGHLAQAGPELESMASRSHPAWVWAGPYRITDLALICDPEVRRRCQDLGLKPASLRDFPVA
jgi:predicted glycoside hydrolase/deacetylase ChbG (UPF0249 family)